MDADPLQPDRVEHPRRRLDDALGWMSFARRQKQSLRNDAAELRQIHRVAVFDAVPEAAARGEQRILQPKRADGDGEIDVTV